jgi:hypothetical protein
MGVAEALSDRPPLPLMFCSDHRAEDCAGDLEWCADDRLRCDVHADVFASQRRHRTATCRNCGVGLWANAGLWWHTDECPTDSPCWSGMKGPEPE